MARGYRFAWPQLMYGTQSVASAVLAGREGVEIDSICCASKASLAALACLTGAQHRAAWPAYRPEVID